MKLVWLWLARLLLAGLLYLAVTGSQADPTSPDLQWLAYTIAIVCLGLILYSFEGTERLGGVIAVFGIWAFLTWYAVVAFVDPAQVVSDSLGSRRVQIDADPGAYAFGAFVFLVANGPLVAWLWLRSPQARERRRRRREAQRREVVARNPPPVSPAVHAAVLDRRQRARRRRKEKARRGR